MGEYFRKSIESYLTDIGDYHMFTIMGEFSLIFCEK